MKDQETQDINQQDEIKQEPVLQGWKKWLNFQSVVKQIPFILFLTLLAVIYIYNGHYADKTTRNIRHDKNSQFDELEHAQVIERLDQRLHHERRKQHGEDGESNCIDDRASKCLPQNVLQK